VDLSVARLRHPIVTARAALDRLRSLIWSGEPWMSRKVIRFCERELHREMTGLEWGSGRSTVWFASRLAQLTSVEGDPDWYARIRAQLPPSVDYRLCPPEHPLDQLHHPTYEPPPAFVAVADEFPEESLDFVVVDGPYREACIQRVLPRLRSGGLLLVDNTNWKAELSAWGVPRDWPITHQSHSIRGNATTVWRRP
jgi:Methyltransferase domain